MALERSTTLNGFVVLTTIFLFLRSSLVHGTSMVCSTASSYGYACNEYSVVTEDGYILSLQRIPSRTMTKQPVLLEHGLVNDGYTWLSGQRDQSLPLALADEGFDVWIANARGTRTSKEHTHLNAFEPAYWQWTWDELTKYDLTANVDFIYNQTGQSVHYIGHSMGTTIAMASFTLNKSMDKLKTIGLLCPVAYLNHLMTEITHFAAQFHGDELLQFLGISEFFPGSELAGKLASAFCSSSPTLNARCGDLVGLLTGNICCIEPSILDNFLKTAVQPTSTVNLVHMAQMVRDGTFAMYDYSNPILNMQKYSQLKPPAIQISSIPPTLPIFLSYGGHDALSDPTDVGVLLKELQDHHQQDKLVVQFVPEYAHLDYIVARNVKARVYDPLISFLKANQ